MRKYFIAGLVGILVLSIGIMLYGAYLNQQGELVISRRMEDRRLPLRGAKAGLREMYPRFSVSAVNLYAAEMADAVALIDGRITESLATRNAVVAKGQPLFTIVNESIPSKLKEANSGVLKAEAQLSQARNTYSRYSQLMEYGAVSAEQFDAAKTQYLAAEAELEAAEARMDDLLVMEGRQEVVAPLDGQVLMHYREVGSYVQAGTALALVGDFRALQFDTRLEDRVADFLYIGQKAQLVFNNSEFPKIYGTSFAPGNRGSEQEFSATVMRITPPLSAPATVRSVKWSIDNSAGLLEPQTYSGVNVRLRERRSCLALPLSAMTDTSRTAVFIVGSDGTLEKREVRTGMDDGKYVEILSGVAVGEIAVTSGAKGLSEGMKVEVELEQ